MFDMLRRTHVVQLAVSVLTTALGYLVTTALLLGLAVLSAVTETLWVAVVYERFSVLSDGLNHNLVAPRDSTSDGDASWTARFQQEKADWVEFARMPIFASWFARRASADNRLRCHLRYLLDYAVIWYVMYRYDSCTHSLVRWNFHCICQNC